MQFWTITFLLLALVAGTFGFGLVTTATASVAQILFFIFLGISVVSFVLIQRDS